MTHPSTRRKYRAARRAFTLVELVVTISILGLLIALLLPAIQSARESARATQCRNNLHQFGVALNEFQSIRGRFPSGRGFSLHVKLLQALDSGVLYNSVNLSSIPWDTGPDTPNHTALSHRPSMFLCPSTDFADLETGSATSYVGCAGVGFDKYGHNDNGLFSGAGIAPTRITDGLAHTTAISEWVLADPASDPRGGVFKTPNLLIDSKDFDRFAQECRSSADRGGSIGVNPKDSSWLMGDFGHTLFNLTLNIGGLNCTNQGFVQQGAWSAGSQHPGGANTLFVDGHVQFIKNTTSVSIWRSLGTRSGAEVIDDSF